MNTFELLGPYNYFTSDHLDKINYWKFCMKRTQGWHYDFDLSWILENINNQKLKVGSTILDAGAGMGITQFMLASLGYNVISLDYSRRYIPDFIKEVFNIIDDQTEMDYDHSYINHVNYNEKSNKIISKIKDKLLNKNIEFRLKCKYCFDFIKKYILHKTYLKKSINNEYGSIRFIRSPFHDIKLENCSIDLLVSISAIEHADISLFSDNINEFKRVIKPNGNVLITTSLSNKINEQNFDENTKGWCFSKDFIEKELNTKLINSEVKSQDDIINCKKWYKNIESHYYYDTNSPFYNFAISELPYLPIGIKINE